MLRLSCGWTRVVTHRWWRLVTLALLAAGLGFAGADLASAQGKGGGSRGSPDGDFQLRLYINAYSRGEVSKTPYDTNGNSKGDPFGNDGATLEAIFYKHFGLGVSQDYQYRSYTDASGNDVHERWVSTYYTGTGYLRPTGKSHWNLFLGASTGTVDRYSAEVNGAPYAAMSPARNLPLTRYFGGFELAFSRIGFRAAYIKSESADTIAGQKVELNQTLQVLSVFIPFH